MSTLHERLVETAAKAVSDRWGHRNDPPGRLMIEDAQVVVYALLRHLANEAVDVNEDHQLVWIASELDVEADKLDREGFVLHHGTRGRVSWKELQAWAERERLAREAEARQDVERRYGKTS